MHTMNVSIVLDDDQSKCNRNPSEVDFAENSGYVYI